MQTNVVKTQAAMSNHRFERPLSTSDKLREFPYEVRRMDLLRLKTIAREKGRERAAFVKKQLPNESVVVQIFHFLTLNRYRRGSMKFIEESRAKFLAQIECAVRNGLPIEIIISFFGYKVQNQLKTWSYSGTEVDISEVGSILRFYEIVSGIQCLYSPGAIFRVACDGVKYSRAVGYAEQQGTGYYKNVKAIVDYFGIADMIDVFEESNFFPYDYLARMEAAKKRVWDNFNNGDPNSPINKFILDLSGSIIYTIPISVTVSYSTIFNAFSSELSDETLFFHDHDAYHLREWLRNEAVTRAINYIAAYDAIKEAQVIEKIAPLALRGTVHPKPGQMGLYAMNKETDNVFPHHGQGISTDFSLTPDLDKLRVRYRVDLLRSNEDLVGIVLPRGEFPFSNELHPFTFVHRKSL